MKVRLYLCFLFLICVLTGCNYTQNTEIDNNKDNFDMTQIEMSLLSSTYNDENILNGDLKSYQETGLKQIRSGLTYLSQRYSEVFDSIEFIDFTPANQFKKWGVLNFKYLDKKYTVNIEFLEDNYVCSDNFFNYFVNEEYSAGIEQILSNSGYSCKVHTEFISFTGNSFDINLLFDDILENDFLYTKIIHIYVDSFVDDISEMQNILNQNNVYGNCVVYTVNDLGQNINYLEENRVNYPYDSFNCGY